MTGLAVLAVVFIGYSAVAARLGRWSITAPMVFIAAGALIGPHGLGILDVATDVEAVKIIAEVTLALILFADASSLRWREVRLDATLPARLLLLGFPLTVLAGAMAGWWLIPAAGWATAALAASMLAPTDAALGLGVFTDRSVPARIRRALNVESGLNDGLATPLVTLFLAVVVAAEGAGPDGWVAESARELGTAIAVGALIGLGAGHLISGARRREWTSPMSERLAVLATALLSYTTAVAAGGNGFVAAFAAGILFASASAGRLREATEFTEDLGLFASYLIWALFGALLVAPVLTHEIHPSAIVYALVSLTLVRLVPVALALAGTGLRPGSIAFMGWFGPRGLASVLFTLIVFESFEAGGLASERLVEVATWTILLSVIAHGLTAGPLAAAYGRAVADAPVEHREPAAQLETRVPRDLSARSPERGADGEPT
ncbi:sodium:proton antiporter [Jiangella aurantiaca]|uniref:Sodium:proton antiporter n=1 Tax=Jiangella aurantiaca TaxID=2530373 RepID=A0A4R5A2A5_9ACTN|nr:cation:proton antiporter [Jiangella aurantiaca]TDD64936.1 sodium:proton antiporter [Jiangella aurantiaca]